ncbi:MAG TPA: DNA-binding response regulator [Microscillaceae bacterium]|nr:DNA-binding response regulator [Microscillaceae bacterium]
MKIIVVEDEATVARRIVSLTQAVLGTKLTSIVTKQTFYEAKSYIFEHSVDVLLLDLNLNGEDGFELLKLAVSGAFHTIVISAYEERALEAFEYGVVDFLSKPFTRKRLRQAFERIVNTDKASHYLTKYLSVRVKGGLKIVPIEQVMYIKGAGVYVELFLKDGTVELYDKTLERLMVILPAHFVRIHKSYIANFEYVKMLHAENYNKITCEFLSGASVPVSRIRYKEIKDAYDKN